MQTSGSLSRRLRSSVWVLLFVGGGCDLDAASGNPFGDPGPGTGQPTGEPATPAEDTDFSTISDGAHSSDAPHDTHDSSDAPDTDVPTEPPICGDGVRQGDEACDGDDFGDASCGDFGFEAGILVCTPECTIRTEGCATCGDGTRDPTEVCDGTDFGGETCMSQGFGGGTLGCANDCGELLTGDCTPVPTCGDGVRNGNEQCDGTDLGGQTCQGLGFDTGSLACNAGACTFNTSGCSYLDCTTEGNFCLFDSSNPQSTCCPPGVGGNTLGLCILFACG